MQAAMSLTASPVLCDSLRANDSLQAVRQNQMAIQHAHASSIATITITHMRLVCR